LLDELSVARRLNRHFDSAFTRFAGRLRAPAAEVHARALAKSVTTLMQARLLLGAQSDAGARAVAEGFCATRLNADSGWGAVFGASDAGLDSAAILQRAWPG
jgi:hypothetical protein